MQNNIDMQCHLCQSKAIFLFDSFASLGRATSDCKPWSKGGKLCICNDCCMVQKIIDLAWREEATYIYKHYELYHQSMDGKEQPVFNSETGSSLPRSEAVLKYLHSMINLKDNGYAIDIGCGVGNMLKSMAKTCPTMKLFGLEPNAHKQSELENINNVVEIYTELNQLQTTFDLITMVHVLEHIDAPAEMLKRLKSCMAPDGYLLIAVPDYTTNPFDLIIADHASHFSVETLSYLLFQSGFELIDMSTNVVNKEILLLCKASTHKTDANRPIYHAPLVQKQLDWMASVVEAATVTAQKSGPFGIFGTSIAANWIYGELSNKIDFFVDEDVDRVGQLYHGRPVYSVYDIPKDSHTFICLQPNVVKNIMNRISSRDYYLYATPNF